MHYMHLLDFLLVMKNKTTTSILVYNYENIHHKSRLLPQKIPTVIKRKKNKNKKQKETENIKCNTVFRK